MSAVVSIEPAGMGHNNPPAPTPLEAFTAALGDLADTTHGIAAPTTPEQAADVTRVLDEARALAKAIDEARATDKRPHDDAAKAVQALWKPLLTRADTIAMTAKAALEPWLIADRERKEAAARAERDTANAAAEIARKARATMDYASLSDREEVERLTTGADAAYKAAERAENAKANVRGDGKAVSLRTSYRPYVTDYTAFSRWAWWARRAEYETMLDELARKQARATIPGVEWTEVRSVA